MTVLDNLDRIKQIKENIKQSITEKGVDMAGVPFYEYPNKIGEIKNDTISKVAQTKVKFANSTFTEIPDGYDFTGVEDFSSMFYNCRYLEKLRPIEWESATNANYCFANCVNITGEIRDNYFHIVNAPHLTSAEYMFNCVGSYNYSSYSKINITAPSLRNCYNICSSANCETVILDVYNEDKTENDITNLNSAFENCVIDYITIKANGNIKANNIFLNSKSFYIFLDGDWSDAIFNKDSFVVTRIGSLKFSSETKLRASDLFLDATFNVDDYYGDSISPYEALDIVRNNLGEASETRRITFNSIIEEYFSEEDFASAASKNWIIAFT